MHPTNPAQYDDATAGRVPQPDQVNDGVWSIPLPMSQPNNPFSLCYVVQGDDSSLHLIDSGYDTDDNWELLRTGLAGFGLSVDDIASLVVSHLHPDHLGMSERLRSATGAKVGMLSTEIDAVRSIAVHGFDLSDERLERWGVPRDRRLELRHSPSPELVSGRAPIIDRAYDAGELLDIPGRVVEVLATPGHTAGSASFVDREAGLLYTGDTVLPTIFSGLGLGAPSASNPIADYLASLQSLARFDDDEIAPGHGFRFRGLADRRADLAEHHLRRSRAAAAVVREHPSATVWEIASRLRWTGGWEKLRGFFLLSALGQTEQHVDFARSDAFPG